MIAVTGLKGFLGRALEPLFRSNGTQYVALDGDVRSPATFSAEFDTLIHLAAALPTEFSKNPGEAEDINFRGTETALAACQNQHAKMIFASTFGVYNPNVRQPVDEDSDVLPGSRYATSKRACEKLILDATKKFGSRHRILRLFNLYGPGKDRHSVIKYAVNQIKSNNPVELLSPHSKRDFVHVSDVAQAFFLSATSSSSHSIFNIGSGKPHEVVEAVRMVARFYDREHLIGECATPVPPETVYANPQRAKSELGWRAEIPLERGIKELCSIEPTSA